MIRGVPHTSRGVESYPIRGVPHTSRGTESSPIRVAGRDVWEPAL